MAFTLHKSIDLIEIHVLMYIQLGLNLASAMFILLTKDRREYGKNEREENDDDDDDDDDDERK